MILTEIKEKIRHHIEAAPDGIAAVYLFGSRATGREAKGSDLDVAVLYSTDPEPTLAGLGLGLAGELERVLGMNVDLVVLNGAPVDLSQRVLHAGSLVVEPDPSARIRFEVRTRNEYWDLEPYLREYRQPQRRHP